MHGAVSFEWQVHGSLGKDLVPFTAEENASAKYFRA